MRAAHLLQKRASSRLACAQRGQAAVFTTTAAGGGIGAGGRGSGADAGITGTGAAIGGDGGIADSGAIGESADIVGRLALAESKRASDEGEEPRAAMSAFLKGGYASAGFQSALSSEPTGQTRVSPSKPGSFNSSSIPAGPCVELPSCA
jgi:hypothetical protein